MRAFDHGAVPRPQQFFDFAALNGPVDLEIGAGQGLHAIQYCQNHPGRNLIALERTANRFALLESRRLAHPALHGLTIQRADAMAFVAHFVPDRCLEKVFLLYPNPYPKQAQANLRWHRSPFMRFLHGKIKDGGHMYLATNLQWYADEAEEWLCRTSGLFKLKARRTLDPSAVPRTHFERKYLARGESCFDLVFEKGLQ